MSENDGAEEQERVRLEGQAAIDLWKQGKDAWNSWIDEHMDADISFENVDFSQHISDDICYSFEGFRFPNGDILFDEAEFGDGEVTFSRAEFGDGVVSFFSTTFGEGNVAFHETEFGGGYVSFLGATFGKGVVSFLGATFGDGEVEFIGADFGEGEVSFLETRFGEGNVAFLDATFGGPLNFRIAKFDASALSLENCAVTGTAEFAALEGLQSLSRFTLRGSSFLGPLIIEGEFTCIPDLRRTRTDHHVDLDEVSCSLKRHAACPRLQKLSLKANDSEDAGRLRRLKELAEGNRDHAAALFGNDPGVWGDLLIIGQAGLSFAFVFLIGLGLRNRFRL